MASSDYLESENRNRDALRTLSTPVSAGDSAPTPWSYNAHFGPPQDVARHDRELAPINIPSKKVNIKGKFQSLLPTEAQNDMQVQLKS